MESARVKATESNKGSVQLHWRFQGRRKQVTLKPKQQFLIIADDLSEAIIEGAEGDSVDVQWEVQ